MKTYSVVVNVFANINVRVEANSEEEAIVLAESKAESMDINKSEFIYETAEDSVEEVSIPISDCRKEDKKEDPEYTKGLELLINDYIDTRDADERYQARLAEARRWERD